MGLVLIMILLSFSQIITHQELQSLEMMKIQHAYVRDTDKWHW
jgi:hypothetical protein